ncbi:HNH endonuclease [Rhizobium ruizarguesonis]|uniref:HNH endonuclease n=1 Tax=Rhizobium ruizarguesonis TaxID=2081791 RepID=UPI0010304F01|nr:HNH endonuclease [Rhizobium ruizarguesonis]TAY93127.1 HNH endonuclease [Rhizobium ruizarguesonis]
MAVTQGHGNPNWTRDETLLALDLYMTSDGVVPSPKAFEVKELSDLLRSLPYHEEAAKQSTFRNPDGVGFKLMNIRQVATGKGLGNVSNMDRQVWAEFGHRPDEVHRIATAIKAGIVIAGSEQLPDVEQELPEGRLLTALHLRRERNPKVRKLLLDDRRKHELRCEICDLSRPDLEISMQEAMFEAHHLVPLAEAGERSTRLTDLALLCACCHRLIHRAMVIRSAWISIADTRKIVATPESKGSSNSPVL